MERPGERIRLKDRIVENISKAIKSIQELVFYQYNDSALAGYDDSVTLYSNSHLCHKLCENLDHTLLHGLKHVIRGYWRVVKQLSPYAMVKEIDMLANVTTDLGKGRAWLYASLNEGLLESYIRLLCDNDKLLKKYYAKEALVLDRDRMSVLLTLASGLDCVTFRLDYDVPYLDLNAYPPRSRRSSEQEANASSDSSDSYLGHPSRYRSRSEVFANLSVSTFGLSSDSDSLSLASFDTQSHSDDLRTKVSTISADSGFSADSSFTNVTRKYSETSSETVWISRLPNGICTNNASASSLTSLGDPDKHRRLENVVSSSIDKNEEGQALEVIRIKSKKGNVATFKKKSVGRDSSDNRSKRSFNALMPSDNHSDGKRKEISKSSNKTVSCVGARNEKSSVEDIVDRSETSSSVISDDSCEDNLRDISLSLEGHLGQDVREPVLQCDSGADIRCMSAPFGKSLASSSHTSVTSGFSSAFSVKDKDFTSSGSALFSTSLEDANASASSGQMKALASLGSSLTSTNSGSLMVSASSGSAVTSLGSGSAMISDSLGSAVTSLGSGSVITLAGSGSAMILAGSGPAKSSPRSESVKASIENKGNEPCYLDVTNFDSSQELTCPQSKSNLFPSSADVATKSSASSLINNKHSGSTADIKSRNSVPAVPLKSDPTDGFNDVLNPTVHIPRNQITDNSTTSCQRQPDEASFKQYKSIGSDQIRPKCERIISLSGDNEQQGFPLSLEDEDAVDVYASNIPEKCQDLPKLSGKSLEAISATYGASQVERVENHIDLVSGSTHDVGDRQETEAKDTDLSLRLDNNTVLELMLNVFTREDEKFVKMFVTWKNHTEGDPGTAYLLISDQCLYILHYHRAARKYVRQSCTQLTDIIFISIGLNGQTLNIESRGENKQKQRLWLSPGNVSLSQAILTCLADAVKVANEHVSGRSRFSVGSEVPLQKIALRKYISGELNCKPQDVTLWDYSLVFWEDLSSVSPGSNKTMYKEGALHLSSHDSIRGHVWKPVYVILKNSMLCIKNTKQDSRPHSYLSLAGDQCVGCRLTSHAGQDNCVELILSSKGSWVLSATSQAEISEWGHSLCLAVSQGTMDIDMLSFCVPCCAVLTCHSLVLCHENLYTKFFRTLARCQLRDVVSILVDRTDAGYCIINFKHPTGNGPSCQWVLYFNSPEDLERHKAAFCSAWKDIHRTDLPVLPLDNVALQFYCRTNVTHLRQQLAVS